MFLCSLQYFDAIQIWSVNFSKLLLECVEMAVTMDLAFDRLKYQLYNKQIYKLGGHKQTLSL